MNNENPDSLNLEMDGVVPGGGMIHDPREHVDDGQQSQGQSDDAIRSLAEHPDGVGGELSDLVDDASSPSRVGLPGDQSWPGMLVNPGGLVAEPLPRYADVSGGSELIVNPEVVDSMGADIRGFAGMVGNMTAPESLGAAGALPGSAVEVVCEAATQVLSSVFSELASAGEELGSSVSAAAKGYEGTDGANAGNIESAGEM